MFYRVVATLNFNIEDEAQDFYHDCQLALPQSVTINPGKPNYEQGFIQIHTCYHDSDPSKPCQVLLEDHTP